MDGELSRRNGAGAEIRARNVVELIEQRRRRESSRSRSQRLADRVARFAGSVTFIASHALWYGAWLLLNTSGVAGIQPFDPFPFTLLTTIVSLEAIFLSSFVLINQNHMQELAEERAELDLHVNLLAERETTEVLRKLDRIERALPMDTGGGGPEVQELMKETPEVPVAAGESK